MGHHTVGFVLRGSVHIHSVIDYKARQTVLMDWTSLAHYLRSNVELVGGDFNMSRTNARHLLAAACRSGAFMARYHPAFPADTTTHYTSSQHCHTATSIDHILIRGARTITSADVLPSPNPHRALAATVEPLDGPRRSPQVQLVHGPVSTSRPGSAGPRRSTPLRPQTISPRHPGPCPRRPVGVSPR